MQKTRLGISVGLLGAAIYFAGLIGGFFITAIIGGYVLLFEENEWLKKSAVKALSVIICLEALMVGLGLIPDFFGLIEEVSYTFGGNVYIPFIGNFFNDIIYALEIVEKALLLMLGMKALNQGTVAVPVVDKLIDKYMG